jgi:hypothetical protein
MVDFFSSLHAFMLGELSWGILEGCFLLVADVEVVAYFDTISNYEGVSSTGRR